MTPRMRCMYIVSPMVNTSDGMAVVAPSPTGLCGSSTRLTAWSPPTEPSMRRLLMSELLDRKPTGQRQSLGASPLLGTWSPLNVSPPTNSMLPSGHRAGMPRSDHGAWNGPVSFGPLRLPSLVASAAPGMFCRLSESANASGAATATPPATRAPAPSLSAVRRLTRRWLGMDCPLVGQGHTLDRCDEKPVKRSVRPAGVRQREVA